MQSQAAEALSDRGELTAEIAGSELFPGVHLETWPPHER